MTTAEHLSKQIDEMVEGFKEQFGIPLKEHGDKLKGLDTGVGELRDRIEECTKAMTKVGELKDAVESLQNLQKKRVLNLAPEFDPDVLKFLPTEQPDEARSLIESFIGAKTVEGSKHHRLQELHDNLLITKAFMERRGSHWESETMFEVGGFGSWNPANSKNITVRKWNHEYEMLLRDFAPGDLLEKAFDSIDATRGGNLLTTVLSSQLLRYLEVTGAVIPLFRSFPMPAQTFKLPITTSTGRASVVTETGDDQGTWPPLDAEVYGDSANVFAQPTFTAVKMRAYQGVSGELIEDSVVPMVEFISQEMGESIRRGIEDAMLNGDTDVSATRLDDNGPTSVGDARTAFIGLRHWATAAGNDLTTAAGAPMTAQNIFDVKRDMGRYGLLASNVTLITGITSYYKMLVVTNIETIQNFGARATLLTGALTQITGSNVVTSEYMDEDLHTTGRNASTQANDTTSVIAVHTPSWWLGNWRGITLERSRIAQLDQDYIFAWWRGDFEKIRATSEPTESIMVNVLTA